MLLGEIIRVHRGLRLARTLCVNYDLSLGFASLGVTSPTVLLCNAFGLVLRGTLRNNLIGSASFDWLKRAILAGCVARLLTHVVMIVVSGLLVIRGLSCHRKKGFHFVFVSRYRRYRSARRFSFSTSKDPTGALALTPG